MSIQVVMTRLAFVLLLFTAIGIAWNAAKVVGVWMLSQKVSADTTVIQQLNPETAEIAFTETLGAAEVAVSLLPDDTDIRIQAGDAWYLSAFFQKDNSIRDKNAQKAIMHYERAVELRPAWPYHYVDLYELYFLTDGPVEKQIQMLRGVAKYGLWDRDLKDFLLEQTALLEQSLPQDLRMVREDLQRFMESDSKSESDEILEELRRGLQI